MALENAITPERFEAAVNKISESQEYQILKTSQGLGFLGLETDSHKALRSMISQRGADLNIHNPEQLLPGAKTIPYRKNFNVVSQFKYSYHVIGYKIKP
ncbi:hypothetical protein Lery_1224 [Legionella erythra]|uniref:DrrA phosphatidylinositol 4-phosphate binding domain-containing protein n=2 Tax=Legionella erythra TaxID=448 RepID=A0A0W0TRZ3_LEGER|nr:hypothetical protein Lery_1224 [Legionella erythra]